MSYSAKDLFPDHYTEGIKRDASPEELKSRRQTIERLLPETGVLVWIIYLKIYLGITKEDDESYLKIVDEFKKDDENFLVKNTNLLRLLLGLAIMEKIEKNDSYVSDFLAIAIRTHSLTPQDILPQLYKFSEDFWISECEKKRDVTLQTNPTKIKSSVAKINLPAVAGATYPETASFQAFTTGLSTGLTALVKDNNANINAVNLLIDYASNLQSAYNAVSEETNILWWLFSAYSDILQKPFNAVSPQALSGILPLDLARLTTLLPGVGKINNIIHKPFSSCSAEDLIDRPLSEIINGIAEHGESLKKKLPTIDSRLTNFCPFLVGIETAIEFAETEWKSIYNKKIGINSENILSLQLFSTQLYQELMLLRVFTTFDLTV